MEVTSKNFTEVLEELDEIIENADFFVIDGEFTGVAKDNHAFSTLPEAYENLKKEIANFLLIQFGLSVFTYDQNANKYKQNSYSFYVFPQSPKNLRRTFVHCLASSVVFLANEGFDFNKLFKYGISYLTAEEEENMYKLLKDETAEKPPDVSIPEKLALEIADTCTKVESLIKSDAEEISVDNCTTFRKRLINQEVQKRWPDKFRIEESETDKKTIIIRKAGTKEEEEKRDVETREKKKQKVQEAAGLSILMKKISSSEKLIIGHNMLLDICHIVQQCFCVLPENYEDFKELIHGLFPRLLDTKFICQSQEFKSIIQSSNLQNLLNTLSKPPFSLPEVIGVPNRSYSVTETKAHEAGFDAYITGLCFIALSNFLDSRKEPITAKLLPGAPLHKFLNKIVLGGIKDISHINLTGKDPKPNRSLVFHVTFPKTWKYDRLEQLFGPFACSRKVFVYWLSETSAYVSLPWPNNAKTVMKELPKGPHYKVQTYADHRAQLAKPADNPPGNSNHKVHKLSHKPQSKPPQKEIKGKGKKSPGKLRQGDGGERRSNHLNTSSGDEYDILND